MRCPWCGKEVPIEEYSNHVDDEHPKIVPAGERRSNNPTNKTNPVKNDKEYEVNYIEKGTAIETTEFFTRKELIEFYQQKPYEKIIFVHRIKEVPPTEEAYNRHLDRAKEAD